MGVLLEVLGKSPRQFQTSFEAYIKTCHDFCVSCCRDRHSVVHLFCCALRNLWLVVVIKWYVHHTDTRCTFDSSYEILQ